MLDARQLPDLKEVKNFKGLTDRYFARALKTLCWNRTHTARALGISVRTLRTRIYKMRDQGWFIP